MRLFIAIDSSKEIQDYLLEIQNKLDTQNANLRAVKSFHLTLKFLGDVKNPEDIIKKLKQIKFKKFDLTLSTLGVFPNENHIRVVWLGLNESEELINLYQDIENTLEQFKFKKDFKFHPHFTLARVSFVKDKTKFNQNLEKINIEEKTFSVNDFVLYESTLTPTGPIYKIRKKLLNNIK